MTARQPAFWRVVTRDSRLYWTSGRGHPWSACAAHAVAFTTLGEAEGVARDGSRRVVPVYVTVRKVQRGHDFAWAFRQSKAGKEVRVLQDNGVWRNCKTLEALVLVEAILKLSNAWQLVAQS